MRVPASLAWLQGPMAGPLDGGYGWVVVGGSFTAHVIVLGLQYSFGVLYQALLNDPDLSGDRAALAWVGSVAVAFMLGMGVFTGALVQKYGERTMTMVGALFCFAGLELSSIMPSVYGLYLSYGVILGIGLNLGFSPSVMIISRYFNKKRSLATGMAVAGSGVGTFLLAVWNDALISRLGWRACLQIDGFIALLSVAGAGALYVPVCKAVELPDTRLHSDVTAADGQQLIQSAVAQEVDTTVLVLEPPAGEAPSSDAPVDDEMPRAADAAAAAAGPLNEQQHGSSVVGIETPVSSSTAAPPSSAPAVADRKEVWKSAAYRIVCVAIGVYAGMLFIAYTYIVVFAKEAAGMEPTEAARLLSGIGIASTVGRVAMGRLADSASVSKLKLLQVTMMAAGASTAALAVLGTQVWYLYVYIIVFGINAGSIVSLVPPLLVDMLGLPLLPHALGGTYTVQAPAVLLGPPLGGWLYMLAGNYTSTWLVSGLGMVAGGAMLLLVRQKHRLPDPKHSTPSAAPS